MTHNGDECRVTSDGESRHTPLVTRHQSPRIAAIGLDLGGTKLSAAKGKQTRHSSGKSIFDIADIIVDSCAPIEDASVPLKNHQDKVGPVSTMAFITCVWMTVCTMSEILADRGVKLYINPSHNVPGDTTAKERLDAALAEYKRRIAGV